MIVGTLQISIYAPWVHSLKEKRMIVKSICAKVINKYHVSIAEVQDQDIHQRIVLGIAYVSNDYSFCDSVMDNIIQFIEGCTEGEIIEIIREFR